MSDAIYLLYAFIGSFSFGLTAILLKIGMEKPNIFRGMVIRGLASVPILIGLSIYSRGSRFYEVYTHFDILYLIILTSMILLLGDILLMRILSKKPVGVITPIITINPIFTTILLLITNQAVVTIEIVVLTLIIVFGVFLVTFKTTNGKFAFRSSFDVEALQYGLIIAILWGIMNYLDILIVSKDDVDSVSYSTIKFFLVSIVSLTFLAFNGFFSNKPDPITETVSSTSKSVKFMMMAGFTGWVAGSLFVYTAYEQGDPAKVNPIIGLNPLFAIILSIFLKHETITKVKFVGIMLCVTCSILLVQ